MLKFASFHPITNLIFFVGVTGISMCVMHPVFVALSLVCSLALAVALKGFSAVRLAFFLALPMSLVSVGLNLAFNQNGQTPLITLCNRVISIESAVAGFATAGVICSVVFWLLCFNAVLTSDKFLYIFGKFMPSVALIISMALRLFPRIKGQFAKTLTAQSCIGRNINSGKLSDRLKNISRVITVMSGWAFENSLETADSMNGRGYALTGKTSFNIYKFKKGDFLVIAYTLFAVLYIVLSLFNGKAAYEFYPVLNMDTNCTSVFAVFFILCNIPLILELWEKMLWKYYQSKI